MRPDRRGKRLLDEENLVSGGLIKGYGRSDLSNITSREENEDRQSVLYSRTKMSIIKSLKYDPDGNQMKQMPTEEVTANKFLIQNSGIVLYSEFENIQEKLLSLANKRSLSNNTP